MSDDLRAQVERIVYDCTGERVMLPDLPYQRKLIDRFEDMVRTAVEAERAEITRLREVQIDTEIAYQTALRAAVEAEREACGKVADEGFGPESCCPGIARSIRARKP